MYSAQHEDGGTPQSFKLKVMSELLTQAHILGLKAEVIVEFLAAQTQAMMGHSPNYCYHGKRARVWIMRGFYPGTSLFFKLILIGDSETGNRTYYAKASPLRVHFKKGQYDAHVLFNGGDLNEHFTNTMENTFFGANHDVKALIEGGIRMPRCMSPKGMKIFRYRKPRKKKVKSET
jgi:hypothetical protein